MCGIAGLVGYSAEAGRRINHKAILTAISSHVRARGPDEQVIFEGTNAFESRQVLIYHSRLSVVGGESGHQPIFNESGNIACIFVGEIYNWSDLKCDLEASHKFGTTSDGEVIVHGYEEQGLDYFSKLDGMFAVAIVDSVRRTLVLARDRVGIKPLSWRRSGNQLAFACDAQTIARLLQEKLEIDWPRALRRVSTPDVANDPIWKGIHDVEPGTAIVVDEEMHVETHRWYTISFQVRQESRQSVEERFRSAVVESIVGQSKVVDGCVGLCLSGGIDSATIASLVSEATTAYTLESHATKVNGDLSSAREVALFCRLPLVCVKPRLPSSLVCDDYLHLLRALESPEMDAHHFLKNEIARAMAADGVRINITGDGADEFMGGYTGNVLSAGDAGTASARLALYLEDTIVNDYRPMILLRNGLSPNLLPYIHFNNLNLTDGDNPDLWVEECQRRLMILRRYNLPLNDRVWSRLGIETRVPFLGNEVLDVLWNINPSERNYFFDDKAVLRRMTEQMAPGIPVARRKTPFFYGDGENVIYKYLYDVINYYDDDISIVEMARDCRAFHSAGILRLDKFDRVCEAASLKPATAASESLVKLTNLALLSEGLSFMKSDVSHRPVRFTSWPLRSQIASDGLVSQNTD